MFWTKKSLNHRVSIDFIEVIRISYFLKVSAFITAVDTHVGNHLFEEAITNFLKNKVVILVTHQVQYLKRAGNILVLHQGKITHEGNFDTIKNSCEDISSFLIAESCNDEENFKEIEKDDLKRGNKDDM